MTTKATKKLARLRSKLSALRAEMDAEATRREKRLDILTAFINMQSPGAKPEFTSAQVMALGQLLKRHPSISIALQTL